MEQVLGFTGADFALVATDTTAARSIIKYSTEEDKIMQLDEHKLLGYSGESGDTDQFTEYIQKNMNLYHFSNGVNLSTHAAANYMRTQIAWSLRSRDMKLVNLILAGHDEEAGASLYWLDYLGCMQKLPFAAHGYGGYFVMSIFDRYHSKDMTLEEGLALIQRCAKELSTRFLIPPPDFTVKVTTKEGIRVIPKAEWDKQR